jgi:uncharacterized protein (DUF1684 family)
MTDQHVDHDHQAHDHQHEHEHHHVLSYEDAIAQFRADKDGFFKEDPASPVPATEREAFAGVPYFPVDPAFRFEDRRLEPYTGSQPHDFEMGTTDGRIRPAHRAGMLRFEIDGRPLELTGYTFEGDEDGSLFVPFLDATSGKESYGAGRYLDLEPEEDGSYALDFNLAYHPYCVYDAKYSCALTPAENRLPVRIEAGERLAPAD